MKTESKEFSCKLIFNKDSLVSRASFVGRVEAGDIDYYFDKDMVEIGYIIYPNSKQEKIMEVENREWSKELIGLLVIRGIRYLGVDGIAN